MSALLLFIVVVAASVSLVATVLGHAPAGDLDGFDADSCTRLRRFQGSPAQALAAYAAAAEHAPGMRVVDRTGSQLLIDLRPTVRILDGNFGMAIRVTATDSGGGTTVRVDAKHKVPWACWDHESALRSAEMQLRTKAKERGLAEVI